MKKILSILIVSISLSCIFGASQKTYDYDSWEYRTTKYLCQIAGVPAPHPVTPVTAAYLAEKIDSIPENRIPNSLLQILHELENRIENSANLVNTANFNADVSIAIFPEMFLSLGDEASPQDWFDGQYKDRNPILDMRLKVEWTEHFYGLISFPVKIRNSRAQYRQMFSQNILIPGSSESFQRFTPFETGLSAGNDFFNFFLGRGKLNIGYGYTGNMFIADNYSYQDFSKFSLYNEYLSYDFSYTHFDQQTTVEENGRAYDTITDWMNFDGPHQIRLSHSFTTRLFDKLEFSLNEGAVIQSESALDIRMLNPFIFMHNWNGFRTFWANNFYGINVASNIGSGFRVNFEMVIDQFQMASEKFEDNPYPNAFGGLLNVSYVTALSNGFLENFAELAYTNPYLYLNNIPGKDDDTIKNQDLILGYYLTYDAELSYTGYKYGPDSIVFAIGTRYEDYRQKWSIDAIMQYKAHGEHGIMYPDSLNQDSKTDITNEENRLRFSLTGIIEHSFAASISAGYNIVKSLNIYSGITYQTKINYNNVDGKIWNNLQWSLGIKFTPTDFLY